MELKKTSCNWTQLVAGSWHSSPKLVVNDAKVTFQRSFNERSIINARLDLEVSQNISAAEMAQFAGALGIDMELGLSMGEGQALALEDEPGVAALSRSEQGFDLSGEPMEDIGSFEPGSFEQMALSDDVRSPFGANFGMIAGGGMNESIPRQIN